METVSLFEENQGAWHISIAQKKTVWLLSSSTEVFFWHVFSESATSATYTITQGLVCYLKWTDSPGNVFLLLFLAEYQGSVYSINVHDSRQIKKNHAQQPLMIKHFNHKVLHKASTVITKGLVSPPFKETQPGNNTW